MWDLPGPGLKLVSPTLAGGFLTTAPPGMSLLTVLRRTSQAYYRMSLNWDFSDVFLTIRMGFSSQHMKGACYQHDITDDVDLDHLA